MPSSVNFRVRDRSDEYGSVGFNIENVTGDNLTSIMTKIGAVQTALAALTTGNIASRTLVALRETVNDTRPSNPYAQRELGLRLHYQDTVTAKKSFITIPCPDLLVVGSAGTDDVDLSGISVVNAIVNALEALVVSPEGNPVDFYRGTIIGVRN
jgi:hypothetical protein